MNEQDMNRALNRAVAQTSVNTAVSLLMAGVSSLEQSAAHFNGAGDSTTSKLYKECSQRIQTALAETADMVDAMADARLADTLREGTTNAATPDAKAAAKAAVESADTVPPPVPPLVGPDADRA